MLYMNRIAKRSKQYTTNDALLARVMTAWLLVISVATMTPALAQAVGFERGAAVAREIQADYHRAATLAQVGRHAAGAGLESVAEPIFEEAAQMADNIENAEDRFWARLQIALAQRQAGRESASKATIESAEAQATKNMPPPDRARLLSVGVQAFFDAGLIDAAIELNRRVRDPYRRDRNCLGMARQLMEQADIEGAQRAAAGIEDVDERQRLHTQLMNLAFREGRLDQAERAVEAMPAGVAADRASRSLAVVRALQKGNLDPKLAELLDGLPDANDEVELLADVVVAQTRAAAIEEAAMTLDRAITVAEGIAEEDLRARALETLAPVAAVTGEIDAALAVINELPIQSFERNAAIRMAVAELISIGDFDNAKRLADLFDHPPHRAMLYSRIALGLTEAGEVENALALIEDLEPARERALTYGDMVEILANGGELKAAMTVAGQIDDSLRATVAAADIVKAHAQAGDFEIAHDMVASIELEVYQQAALRDIAMAEADAGQLQDAKTTAARLTHERYRPEAVVHLATAQAAAGSAEEARQTALTLEGAKERDTALTVVATALAEYAAKG